MKELHRFRQFLTEGVIKENMSLEVDDDYIEISADSGEYSGDLNNDGTVDFSVVYDDGTEFDDSTWKSILGKKHAFVQISNKIPTKVEAAGDYVMITVDLEDLKGITSIAEGVIKEDITKLRGQELLDFFSFTKYMNVDVEELESEFEDAMNYGQFTDPANVEQDKKDFTYENGDRFLDTNEDKMSEYLGFEIDTEQMTDDYFLGDPKGVEFVHSDEEFERWMEEGSSFWR